MPGIFFSSFFHAGGISGVHHVYRIYKRLCKGGPCWPIEPFWPSVGQMCFKFCDSIWRGKVMLGRIKRSAIPT
jgi:hypothetical protein